MKRAALLLALSAALVGSAMAECSKRGAITICTAEWSNAGLPVSAQDPSVWTVGISASSMNGAVTGYSFTLSYSDGNGVTRTMAQTVETPRVHHNRGASPEVPAKNTVVAFAGVRLADIVSITVCEKKDGEEQTFKP